MNGQFVDLFDRHEHGLNYWAGIAVCAGLFITFFFDAIQVFYDWVIVGITYNSPDGDPVTMGGVLLNFLKGRAMSAVGFSLALVVSASFLRKDLILPFAMGILLVVWNVLLRLAGVDDGGSAFSPGYLVYAFLWGFLLVGCMVLAYRLSSNKVVALALGLAAGSLLLSVYSAVHSDIPFVWVARFAAANAFEHFIAGVFLYGGIAYHFCSHGVDFGEYGCPPPVRESGDELSPDAVVAKTRGPLRTVLLLLVTLDLYAFAWIYKVYREIRLRSHEATNITPGRALGFLFIPLFNAFWALWLWVDLPRAIEKMREVDAPTGTPPDRWAITGSMILGTVLGIVGGFWWRPALYLSALFLWTGILLAQSALNSHWEAHRRAE